LGWYCLRVRTPGVVIRLFLSSSRKLSFFYDNRRWQSALIRPGFLSSRHPFISGHSPSAFFLFFFNDFEDLSLAFSPLKDSRRPFSSAHVRSWRAPLTFSTTTSLLPQRLWQVCPLPRHLASLSGPSFSLQCPIAIPNCSPGVLFPLWYFFFISSAKQDFPSLLRYSLIRLCLFSELF